jgi:hypothetical protein
MPALNSFNSRATARLVPAAPVQLPGVERETIAVATLLRSHRLDGFRRRPVEHAVTVGADPAHRVDPRRNIARRKHMMVNVDQPRLGGVRRPMR